MLIAVPDDAAYFPFDHHLASTKLIYPEGYDNHTVTAYGLHTGTNLCATLRPNEGRFGGAVAVEERTENIWTRAGEYELGYVWSHRLVIPEGTIKAGDTWTLSFDVKRGTGAGVRLDGAGFTQTTAIHSSQLTTSYKKYSFTVTYDADYAGPLYILSNQSGSNTFWIRNTQLEKKPFATSFVDGSRGRGNLRYKPSELGFDPHGDWTIGIWAKVAEGQKSWASPFGLGNYYEIGQSEFQIWLNHSGEVKTCSHDNRSGSSRYLFTPNPGEIQEWCYYVVSHDKLTNKYVAYVYTKNRYVKKEHVRVHTYPIADVLKIGSHHILNGLVDDLMITPRVMPDDEVHAIYHSQRPLYEPNRIDHTIG